MDYLKEKIKNIAIVGGMGVGKTTLIEAIAFVSGAITKKGEVERGTTLSDFTVEETNLPLLIISESEAIVPASKVTLLPQEDKIRQTKQINKRILLFIITSK